MFYNEIISVHSNCSMQSQLTINKGAYDAAKTMSLLRSSPVMNAASPEDPTLASGTVHNHERPHTLHIRVYEATVGECAIEIAGIS
jgi:hypothetical protein